MWHRSRCPLMMKLLYLLALHKVAWICFNWVLHVTEVMGFFLLKWNDNMICLDKALCIASKLNHELVLMKEASEVRSNKAKKPLHNTFLSMFHLKDHWSKALLWNFAQFRYWCPINTKCYFLVYVPVILCIMVQLSDECCSMRMLTSQFMQNAL